MGEAWNIDLALQFIFECAKPFRSKHYTAFTWPVCAQSKDLAFSLATWHGIITQMLYKQFTALKTLKTSNHNQKSTFFFDSQNQQFDND